MSDSRAAIQDFIEANANPQHKYGHQPRLYALTQQIGEGLAYDDDVVYAAVWLHDLGVFIGHRPESAAALKTWDHAAYITTKAPAILTESAFPTAPRTPHANTLPPPTNTTPPPPTTNHGPPRGKASSPGATQPSPTTTPPPAPNTGPPAPTPPPPTPRSYPPPKQAFPSATTAS